MKRLLGLAVTSLILMTACEKEVISESYPEMEGFYIESCGLQVATIDSVKNFKVKVEDFTVEFPESKEHSLYPEILANIKSASLRLNITINDEWDGETHINF